MRYGVALQIIVLWNKKGLSEKLSLEAEGNIGKITIITGIADGVGSITARGPIVDGFSQLSPA